MAPMQAISGIATGVACGDAYGQLCTALIAALVGRIDILGKVLDFCPGRRQYFGNTVRGWPSGLSFLGPTLASIERGWVQPAALCQSRTCHFVFLGKAFNCTPYIFMRHATLSFFLSTILGLLANYELKSGRNS